MQKYSPRCERPHIHCTAATYLPWGESSAVLALWLLPKIAFSTDVFSPFLNLKTIFESACAADGSCPLHLCLIACYACRCKSLMCKSTHHLCVVCPSEVPPSSASLPTASPLTPLTYQTEQLKQQDNPCSRHHTYGHCDITTSVFLSADSVHNKCA